MNQKTFLKEYKNCADEQILNKIWQCKIDKDYLLNLSNCNIYDLSPLKECIGLERLSLNSTPITDLKPLIGLSLKELYVEKTNIKDIKALEKIPTLRFLNLSSTKVGDLSALKNLLGIFSLDISNLPIEDLSPIKGLSFEVLDCSNTNIKDINPLNYVRNLNISNTDVSDLTPIKNTKSVLLNASSTKITDLSPLKVFPSNYSIVFLNISCTQITDIEPLKELSRLIYLNIAKTLISDIRPLEFLINQEGREIFWKTPETFSDCGIYLQDCPITNPPVEVVKKGQLAVLEYWGIKPNFAVGVERRKLIINKK
jgi:internalin A